MDDENKKLTVDINIEKRVDKTLKEHILSQLEEMQEKLNGEISDNLDELNIKLYEQVLAQIKARKAFHNILQRTNTKNIVLDDTEFEETIDDCRDTLYKIYNSLSESGKLYIAAEYGIPDNPKGDQ